MTRYLPIGARLGLMVDDRNRIDWRLTAIRAMSPSIAARIVEARRERAERDGGCGDRSGSRFATRDVDGASCERGGRQEDWAIEAIARVDAEAFERAE